jgi:DNA integrity scanning protein DisA with diadenylate cyclase activity
MSVESYYLELIERVSPSKIIILSNDIQYWLDMFSDFEKEVPIYFYHSSQTKINNAEEYSDYNLESLINPMYPDLENLPLLKEHILYLINSDKISLDDRILVILSTDNMELHLMLDIQNLTVPLLVDRLEKSISKELIKTIIKISYGIVRKGKEGFPSGALFLVGDEEELMSKSIQRLTNPFKNFSDEERSILNKDNWPTIHEFSMMDGATIINNNGLVISSGVYITNLTLKNHRFNKRGGRHLAAASITQKTKAIAIVVSSEGVIRIYKNGEEIYEIEGV